MTLNEQIEVNYAAIAARFDDQVQTGSVVTDAFLSADKADSRRGLTLLCRPDAATCEAIDALIATLTPVLGAQYIYPTADLHTTVLSVIPGNDRYDEEAELVARCVECTVRAIHTHGRAFTIRYEGLIASSDSLIVKGYPVGDKLQQLRSAIISELTACGIEEQLSRRYLMIAAHMTVVRFVLQPPSLTDLQKELQPAATKVLGSTRVTQLELTENDWYMRANTLHSMGTYALSSDEAAK